MSTNMNLFCCKIKADLGHSFFKKFSRGDPYAILEPPKAEASFVNSRFFRATCDYTGFDGSELSFAENDVVQVQNAYTQRYLYTARHMATGEIGKITLSQFDQEPIIELQPWYFSNISRIEASELLLQSSEVGTFLVANAEPKHAGHEFSLFVRSEENGLPAVRHFQIMRNNYGFFISHDCFAKHLDQLIKLYHEPVEGDQGIQPVLKFPCRKEEQYSVSVSDIQHQIRSK